MSRAVTWDGPTVLSPLTAKQTANTFFFLGTNTDLQHRCENNLSQSHRLPAAISKHEEDDAEDDAGGADVDADHDAAQRGFAVPALARRVLTCGSNFIVRHPSILAEMFVPIPFEMSYEVSTKAERRSRRDLLRVCFDIPQAPNQANRRQVVGMQLTGVLGAGAFLCQRYQSLGAVTLPVAIVGHQFDFVHGTRF